MKQKNKKIYLFSAIVILIASFYRSGLHEYITLENIQNNLSYLQSQYRQHPGIFLSFFLVTYILITSLSIPGTLFLTLMSGTIFGVLPGTIYSTFSSSVGATMAFLMARYIFRSSVKKKFETKFSTFNSKFEEHGNAYLFMLRIIPVSPYVLVNVLMGLTNIRTSRYFLLTFLGMLPGTFIYVLAGRKILQIRKPSDIMSPEIILAFILLGVTPLIVKLFRKTDKLIRHGS